MSAMTAVLTRWMLDVTGAVEAMGLVSKSTAVTGTAFLQQLRSDHLGLLIVIWDNAPAHGGDALRAYLTTSDLRMHLIRLSAYSPDENADKAIWDWVHDEVTANTCFGTQARVCAHVDAFFHHLWNRTDEVKIRCRTILHTHSLALARM